MSQTTLIIQRQNVLNIVWADNLAISPTVTRFEGISWAAVREAIIGFLGASVFYIVWKGVCGLLWFILIRIPNQYPKIVTVWAIDDWLKCRNAWKRRRSYRDGVRALVQPWAGVRQLITAVKVENIHVLCDCQLLSVEGNISGFLCLIDTCLYKLSL